MAKKKICVPLIAAMTVFFTVALALVAVASQVDESIVDATAPTGSVILAPGSNGSITINLSVTGKQDNPASFKVYRDWTLSGGTFTGSNPQTFNVPARPVANAPATTFSTTGVVSVDASQGAGNFALAIGAFDIVTTSPAALAQGALSSYVVTVSPPTDITAPVITPSVSGTLGNNGWYTSDVTVSWSVVDNESLISSSSGCGSSTINADTSGTTLTCSATSGGGTDSQSVTIKRDATPPTITGTPDFSGWHNGTVTVTYGCSDATSLLAGPCPVADTFTTEGTHSWSQTVQDNAGNSATASGTVNIDLTAPSISGAPDRAANGNGWYKADVIVSFTCADTGGSGLKDCSAPITLGEGAGQSVTGTATDNADNSTSVTVDDINIDETPPTIAFLGTTPASPNGNDWFGSNVALTWSCGDALSGEVSSTVTQTLSGDGADQSATGTCTDKAGNTASDTQTGINIDKSDPTITFFDRAPAANGNGWDNADVTVTWTCSDGVSGVVDDSVALATLTEGSNLSLTGTCEDLAGNTASDTYGDIKVDKTKPTASASASPAANSNGWNNTNVTVTFSGSDGLSGIDFCTAAASLTGEGAGRSASGTCTDKAGNVSDTATQSGINIDKTAPTISGAPDRAANGNGWYNADVTVSFTCADALSGVDSCSGPSTLAEGAAQSVAGSVTDKAGNSASTTVSGINIDRTAPNLTLAFTPNAADGSNGWWKTAGGVPFTWTCSDATSGIDTTYNGGCPSPLTGTETAQGTTNFADQVKDLAGNLSVAVNRDLKLDNVKPYNIAFGASGIVNGGTYYYGFVPAGPTTCTADDDTSLLASCNVTGGGTSLGAHSYTATATDNAGNSDTATWNYTVLAWTLYGFYQPVDMSTPTTTVYNTVKNGSTVPLKFEIFAGSTELTDTAYVKSLKYGQVTCDTDAVNDAIETTATGGTALRYDATAGQFVYNWKTPNTAGKCYSATMETQDGSKLSAFFKLK